MCAMLYFINALNLVLLILIFFEEWSSSDFSWEMFSSIFCSCPSIASSSIAHSKLCFFINTLRILLALVNIRFLDRLILLISCILDVPKESVTIFVSRRGYETLFEKRYRLWYKYFLHSYAKSENIILQKLFDLIISSRSSQRILLDVSDNCIYSFL